MGDVKGFLKVKRDVTRYRPVCERLKDFNEVSLLPQQEESVEQASRCMDCGTPFCHWACPLGNYIPEWNDFLFKGNWLKAFQLLQATNNFPEITGRACSALCEFSCVLGINDDPVTIKENELAIIERAFSEGIVKPNPPKKRTGKQVAVIGSGPAGLACADQLNKAGHVVVVFEKSDKIGGILRYGIPDFKLEKRILDRRIDLLKNEGVVFNTGAYVGRNLKVANIEKDFNALCLAGGVSVPRDLKIEGRELSGIHFAMDYLIQVNKRLAGERIPEEGLIDAKNKRVLVIGGGDTGGDCLGVAHRQGASSVTQIEIMPKPSNCRTPDCSWPKYPLILKNSSSHEEGGVREWAVLTKKFIGDNNSVKKILCGRAKYQKDATGFLQIKEVPGSEFEIEADLVILALGFLHPEKAGMIEDLNLVLDRRGNILTDESYQTSKKGVFSCGDMRRGQSLIVWAISEGRRCAHAIDRCLMGASNLPLI